MGAGRPLDACIILLLVAGFLALPVAAQTVAEPLAPPAAASVAPAAPAPPDAMTMSGFLDRLMIAESGGRADAANPRSTAVGPYQFIESTWLDVVRRVFATETQALTPVQILALRTDPAFSRRAAEAYTKDNAGVLKSNGFEPTFPRLRLAHLLGPQGAVRVLQAPRQFPVAPLLGASALRANPFMTGLTAEALIARAARDLSVDAGSQAGVAAGDIPTARARAGNPGRPGLLVRCNLDRPACRHWKALAVMRLPAGKAAHRQVAMAKAR